MIRCLRCIVRGRVQGVYYRVSTQLEAQRLAVTGYARNLSDGTVETLMCGEVHAVEALRDWLWRGPSQAQVSDVQCMEMLLPDAEIPTEFKPR